MMKTLLLLRHAKSSWDDPGLSDHDRPLSKRGKHDAPRMGRLLSEEGLLPDLILCSTAQRARSTAELVAEESDYQGEIIYNQEVYSFDAEPYRQALAALADDYETVMLVGHNPAIEELLLSLTGKPEAMPTAALAQVELPIQSWAEMKRPVRGKLVEVWRPKEI